MGLSRVVALNSGSVLLRMPTSLMLRWSHSSHRQVTWLQVIGDVLDECGSNIDAAIKRLEQLRLSGNTAPEAAQDPTAAESEAGALDCWAGKSVFGRTSGPHLCTEGTRPMPFCCGKQSCNAALLSWN